MLPKADSNPYLKPVGAPRRNWSMIVGTSIGALNAGALAQYPPEEQCTKARAGFGVSNGF